jgi:transcription-repair coupling factor (superfamily II helicase)
MEKALFAPLTQSGQFQRLTDFIRGGKSPCSVFGVPQTKKAHIYSALMLTHARPLLIVTPNHITASKTASDIEGMTGIKCHVLPQRSVEMHTVQAASKSAEHSRSAMLGDIVLGRAQIVIAPIDAVLTPLCPKGVYKKAMLTIARGDVISPKDIAQRLTWSLYRRESRVEQEGQFAVRGDIVDIFPVGHEHPVRIELFGDDVESVKIFDENTQHSITDAGSVTIYPAIEMPLDMDSMQRGISAMNEAAKKAYKRGKSKKTELGYTKTDDKIVRRYAENTDKLLQFGYFEGMENHMRFFYPDAVPIHKYLDGPIIIFDEIRDINARIDDVHKEYDALYGEMFETGEALYELRRLLYSFDDIKEAANKNFVLTTTAFTADSLLDYSRTLAFAGTEAMVYRGQFDMLSRDVKTWRREKYRVAILVGSGSRVEGVRETLAQYQITATPLATDREIITGEVALLPLYASRGFTYADEKFIVLTENELFGRTKSRKASGRRRRAGDSVLNDIKRGDYVVHEANGIGKFDGVVRLDTLGKSRDYLKLLYMGGDVLYVPTEQMDRVQKYIGAGEGTPKLTRLGGKSWERARQRAKGAVADMTEDLIELYAKRSAVQGYRYSPDGEWQRQFEESFEYQETPDQLSCIEEIKDDMQSGKVMDRLLCGDVGYGKTEVALRAAFKAVMDKKQVALLCPTTILCHQHYMTICERFADFPVEKRELSRFVTAAEQKDTIEKLKTGKVDIVVGTHRLLSEDVNFKDLGLLIIDEEQRFGVTHKEKIKKLRVGVDVLTMTATPIPRTLHMSLSGIRDISMIETPPEERFPVQTFVTEYEEDMIRGAIERELSRGGQIYFVYNRVQTIDMMKRKLLELMPRLRVAVGHGQMPGTALENVMLDFLDKKYDVLLATTIIENGIDIPNVNTLIVYDTDRFGLSQLYQLRGRVGRSNRLSYAYLTWRPSNILSDTARQRLEAISQFTEFGSGLKIAMRDLEIRGAGSILGGQQHGHMTAVGYGLYCKLIDEAVRTIKGEEIEETSADVTLNVLVDAFIPDDYIEDAQDRMDAYRAISIITSLKDKTETLADMEERFGKPPLSVRNLTDVAYLKHKSAQAGIKMISERSDRYVIRLEDGVNLDMAGLIKLIDRSGARFSGQDSTQIFLPMQRRGLNGLIDFVMDMIKLKNM